MFMADQSHDPLLEQLRRYGTALEDAANREPVVIAVPRHVAPPWLARHATQVVVAASALGVMSALGGLVIHTGSTSTTTAISIASIVPRVSPGTVRPVATSSRDPVAAAATTIGTASPSSPAPTPTSSAIVSGFPHLQLALPINEWTPPTHTRTSRVVGDTIDGAFKSVAQSRDRTATLVLSTVVFTIKPADRVAVRGHPAETIVVENTVTIRWQETPGITAVLTTTNLTPSEAVAIALRQVVATSEEEWTAIVASSADAAAPTPWERVANGLF
jgi:hypothetical protein